MDSRSDILRLMNQYSYTIDSGDFDGFAGLFADGEWIMEGGVAAAGQAALRAGMANIRVYADGTPRTRHLTTNIDLDIDEAAGTARGQCYVTVIQQTDEFPLQMIFSGHYFDEFARVDGVWRFRQRFIRRQLVGDMRAHVKAPAKLLGAASATPAAPVQGA